MLLFAAFSLAQKPIEIQLWPQGAPCSNGLTPQDEKVKNGQVLYVEAPTLTVYVAPHGNGKAVVCCPGGGYAMLATGSEGHDMAQWFNAQGITFAVLVYRMPNGHHEVPLSDARQALRIMREHADEWHLNKIGIMGASAGGHLACTAATHLTFDSRPDFQILLYPVVSMDSSITHMGSRLNLLGNHPADSLVRLYSNELQVTSSTPPAFIVLSSNDKIVPVENSLRYYRALVKNGVTASLHIYPVGGHGWGFRDNFPYKREWTEELEKWLREAL